MPNILKQLKLTELSLVDRPANPEATAPIFKADDSPEGELMEPVIKMSDDMKEKLKPYMDKGMSVDEAMKAYEEDMQKSVNTLKTENERLRKALIEDGFVITAESVEKKAPAEYIEIDGESINKADVPAPILKRLEEAEAEKAKADVVKKAEEFGNLNSDVAFKLVEKGLTEDEELLEFLRAVDALFEKALGENGETNVDSEMESASDKLDKMAKDISVQKSISFEKGYAEVLKTSEGKALYKETLKKED